MSRGRAAGRWIAGKIGRVILLALALTLAAALLPYAREMVSSWFPGTKYDRAVQVLTREMEQAGDLIAVRHRESGTMEAGMNGLLVGSVNSVKAPYSYEIGLGLRLRDVEVRAEENRIVASVPEARVLYDDFQITGDPEISDFWHLLSQQEYQKMVDAQAAACRARYENDPEILEGAWQSACEELKRLCDQWTGETLTLSFEKK